MLTWSPRGLYITLFLLLDPIYLKCVCHVCTELNDVCILKMKALKQTCVERHSTYKQYSLSVTTSHPTISTTTHAGTLILHMI